MPSRYHRRRLLDQLQIRARLLITGKYIAIAVILLLLLFIALPLVIFFLISLSNGSAISTSSATYSEADVIVFTGVEERNLSGTAITQLLDTKLEALENTPRDLPILVGGIATGTTYDQFAYIQRHLRQQLPNREITYLEDKQSWPEVCRELGARQLARPILIDFSETALPRVVMCQMMGINITGVALPTPNGYQQFVLHRAYGLLGSVLSVHLQ